MIYMKDITYKGKTHIIEFEMLDGDQNEVDDIKMFKYNKDNYKILLYSLRLLRVDDSHRAVLKDNVGNEIRCSSFLRSPREALERLISSYEQYTPIEAFILEDIVID